MHVVNHLLRLLGRRALEYYDREPVRAQAVVVGAVLAGAAALTIVLPATLVAGVAAVVVPALVAELRGIVASPQTQRELLLAEPSDEVIVADVGEVEGLDVEQG